MKPNRRPPRRPRTIERPSRATAESAVRTLIQWAGDDPDREGLRGTPARVVRAYEEWFAGYFDDPRDYLQRTFEEVAGYDEMVLLRDIRFRVPLRTSHGADHRPCSYRLSPAQAHCRHFKAGAAGRRLCQENAGSGEDDRRDCGLPQCCSQTVRGRCRRRRRP